MAERDSIQSLLVRRKLTRAIADVVRAELTQHLATLTPLFQAHTGARRQDPGRPHRLDA